MWLLLLLLLLLLISVGTAVSEVNTRPEFNMFWPPLDLQCLEQCLGCTCWVNPMRFNIIWAFSSGFLGFFFEKQSNTSYLITWKDRVVGLGKSKCNASLWKQILVPDFAGTWVKVFEPNDFSLVVNLSKWIYQLVYRLLCLFKYFKFYYVDSKPQ